MSIVAPSKVELERIAVDVRRFLEGIWPAWHKLRGRPLPDPLSIGTCQTSSLFLATVLQEYGFDARVEQGNDPAQDEGFFNDGRWHGHAWVVCGGWIVDVSADQFGCPPVNIEQENAARYRKGSEDTAFDVAKQQRHRLVNAALSEWSKNS
ncbi:transglutaminase domain-containing protein [Nisaea sp.]|uniref:transglutaminase domain-containing protein n=1 Tax=Nisaea sp. TaxID=2024842 RepID=UPI003262F577